MPFRVGESLRSPGRSQRSGCLPGVGVCAVVSGYALREVATSVQV